MAQDLHTLLFRWLYLRPSEVCRIPCAMESLGELSLPKRKFREKPDISWSMTTWLDIDLCLTKNLTQNEMFKLIRHLTGRDGYRMPKRLDRKLTRLFKQRGLLKWETGNAPAMQNVWLLPREKMPPRYIVPLANTGMWKSRRVHLIHLKLDHYGNCLKWFLKSQCLVSRRGW